MKPDPRLLFYVSTTCSNAVFCTHFERAYVRFSGTVEWYSLLCVQRAVVNLLSQWSAACTPSDEGLAVTPGLPPSLHPALHAYVSVTTGWPVELCNTIERVFQADSILPWNATECIVGKVHGYLCML